MKVNIHKGDEPAHEPPARSLMTTDAKGRAIKVRQLKAIDRMRLFGFISNDMADKDRWLQYAFLASSCAAINGEEVPMPQGVREIEFLVQRLDDEGLHAVALKLMELSEQASAGGADAAKK